jgi:hypothetical protein
MRTDGREGLSGNAARVMGVVATAFNVTLLVVMALVALRLWQSATAYVANAGGLPTGATVDAVLQDLTLAVSSPSEVARPYWDNLYARFYWWGLAWVNAVFAVGAALVSVAGMRWAWTRLEDALSGEE